MMKKAFVSMGAVLCAVALVLGPGRMWLQVRSAQHMAQKAVDGAQPTAQVIAGIHVQLRDLAKKVAQAQGACDDIARRAEDARGKLEGQKAVLAKARELLARDSTVFEISQVQYTREQVEADARGRVERCRRLQRQVEELAKIEQSVRRHQNELRSLYYDKKARLEALVMRHRDAKLQAEVASLVSTTETPASAGEGLSQSLAQLEGRIAQTERLAQLNCRLDQMESVVPYEDLNRPNVETEIAAVLGEDTDPAEPNDGIVAFQSVQ